MCHDFIPHTASVRGVVVAVVMFLSDIAIASDRYPSIIATTAHLGITRVVVVVTERQRKKLPIISFHVHHVHLRKLTATVPSKPYHSFKVIISCVVKTLERNEKESALSLFVSLSLTINTRKT